MRRSASALLVPIGVGLLFLLPLFAVVAGSTTRSDPPRPSGGFPSEAPTQGAPLLLPTVQSSNAGPSEPPLTTALGNWTPNPWFATEQPLVTYDPADGYMLAFGGHTSDLWYLQNNTTWELQGGVWHPVPTSGSPPEFGEASWTYDAADGLVLLVGVTELGNSPSQPTHPMMETWSYRAGVWTELHPWASPSVRSGWSLAYDAADGYTVLFGGFPLTLNSTVNELNDTWSFLHGNWTPLATNGTPSGRWGAGMTYDASDRAIFLADGGYNRVLGGGSYTNAPRGDDWEYSGGTWRNVTPAIRPPPYEAPSLAYDPNLGAVVLLADGGFNPAPEITWTFRSGTWQLLNNESVSERGSALAYDPELRMTVQFGSLDPNIYGWNGTKWTVVGGVLPISRNSIVDDEADGCLLTLAPTTPYQRNSTYRYDGRGWVPIATMIDPPGRSGGLLTYDAADRLVVLFGGQELSGAGYFNDTWTFAGGRWTEQFSTSTPRGGFGEQLVYDPGIRSAILFGAPPTGGASRNPNTDLLMTWRYANGQWSSVTTAHAPGPRVGESLAYDPFDDWLILFGGDRGFPSLNDTWAFNGSDWLELTPSDAPSPRAVAAFGYDPHAGYLVLVGGAAVDTPLADAWAFCGGDWSPIREDSFQSPGPIEQAQFLDDPVSGRFQLIGGLYAEPNEHYGSGPVANHPGFVWSFQAPPLIARPYPVLFQERGLGAGASWSITLGGTTHATNTTLLTFGVPNGSYAFSVGVPLGDAASPDAGSLVVAGGGGNRSIEIFVKVPDAASVLVPAAIIGGLVTLVVLLRSRSRRS